MREISGPMLDTNAVRTECIYEKQAQRIMSLLDCMEKELSAFADVLLPILGPELNEVAENAGKEPIDHAPSILEDELNLVISQLDRLLGRMTRLRQRIVM